MPEVPQPLMPGAVPPGVPTVLLIVPTPAPLPPIAPAPARQSSTPVAGERRFAGTRRSLGAYAKDGSARNLRRGLGHFVRSGYGGASTATRRMGGTVAGGTALYDALSALSGAGAANLDPAVLRGQSAKDVINAIIEAAHPIDGTLDIEGSRVSSGEALAELLTRHPDANLFNLSEEQKISVVEMYVANDVYRRIDLDAGKTVRDKAPSVTAAMARLNEMHSYVREVVAASFRSLRDSGRVLTRQTMSKIISAAIKETFVVFEGYFK